MLKTDSERLFSEYLDANDYCWDYEPVIAEKSKRPDFHIRRRRFQCYADAKERSAIRCPRRERRSDPIQGLRKLLEQGRKKFKEFGDDLCALVLYDTVDCDTRLCPWDVFGAMLGNPGFIADFDGHSVNVRSARSVFLDRGGKMIRHYAPLQPYESTTNISAILILRQFSVRNELLKIEFDAEAKWNEATLQRKLTADELFETTLAIGQRLGDDPQLVTRVKVCVNPFAHHPLPEDIFNGPYDERWAMADDGLSRVFAGSEVSATEADPLDSWSAVFAGGRKRGTMKTGAQDGAS
jgi:hypothetical protein